jgi:methylmalonyl-CoA/ethylmalonyl-CoA epimerase
MTRIDHLGIAVESIAKARGFYEALGLSVAHEETVEHEQVHTAMIPMNDSRIELLEPTSEDSPVGAGGHLYFFVHPSSAGGVLLEICQDPVKDL